MQTEANETSMDPLAPLVALAGWVTSTTLHVLLGLVLGLVAARMMRHAHLRWTWALVALVLLTILRAVWAGWTSTLLTAAVCAALRGRHWHRQDELAGHDLAQLAAERYGPADALRTLAQRVSAQHGVEGGGNCSNAGPVNIGRAQGTELIGMPLGGSAGGTHTLIVGAAGSGKTVTQAWILTQAIKRGMGVIAIDPKRDLALKARLEHAAHAKGRRFIEWSPAGPTVYNPYARGSASEVADKLLAGERFSEPHYQRQAQRYLGHVVRTLREAELQVSLEAIVRHLDPARLETLARALGEQRTRETLEYLETLTQRQRSDLSGVRDRLAIMAESDFAAWLDPANEGAQAFELLAAVEERAVVYFCLESDTRPLLAQMLAVAILLDLQSVVAALQGRPIPTVVAIDEFAAIASEQVTRLFARARSAGFCLVLCTQELADMRVLGHKGTLDQVLGNISTLIVHRQVVEESAQTISRLAGTTGGWSTSQHSNGRHTRTRESVELLRADTLRGLEPGQAAVITFGAHRAVRIARIFSEENGVPSSESVWSRVARAVGILTGNDPLSSERDAGTP
jgi:type IV secretory pathway TraG/TraD family ATPase VirD4